MRFKELEAQMRVYETAHDHCVLPGMYIVARLDGRNFTRLTKEVKRYEAPFDSEFLKVMYQTVKHLMTDTGFKILYGYTQSDEISLLFDVNDNTFNRKERKINSVLAGEASGYLSWHLGLPVAFDCRVCQIPNVQTLLDYFRWRQEDANRNALNSWCYWTLRKDGRSARQATKELLNLTVADKNDLLFDYGINYSYLPDWQKRGTGLYKKTIVREGFNPKTNKTVKCFRQETSIRFDLPLGTDYDAFLMSILEGNV